MPYNQVDRHCHKLTDDVKICPFVSMQLLIASLLRIYTILNIILQVIYNTKSDPQTHVIGVVIFFNKTLISIGFFSLNLIRYSYYHQISF